MTSRVESILEKKDPDRSDIIELLRCGDEDATLLCRTAASVRNKYVGNVVYLRGLIEFSNICGKNCLYCGIRRDNRQIERYTITNNEVIEAAMKAYRLNFGSIAIQSGENSSEEFTSNVEYLVRTITEMTNGQLGITLSLGEQSKETYQRWYEAGARRYLLRIESSSADLYRRIHPDDDMHRYERRIQCLKMIQEAGYQTGTGVMIGLPSQTLCDLADDILFMRDQDVDMCGMGPFIEHTDTPLGKNGTDNLFLRERFNLTLRMIAIIRLVMKDINIVASTAMQTIDPLGREMAIGSGANIVMPNLTPSRYRDGYRIYTGKPGYRDVDESNISGLKLELLPGLKIGMGRCGDTPHYEKRIAGKSIRMESKSVQ
jgi:biotin synthase